MGQKSFHTVGGLADPAYVKLHTGNQCPLLHHDHYGPRACLTHVGINLYYRRALHDFELEFSVLKRVVCICNSVCFL